MQYVADTVSKWFTPVKSDVKSVMSKRTNMIRYEANMFSISVDLYCETITSDYMTSFVQNIERIGYVLKERINPTGEVGYKCKLSFLHLKHGEIRIAFYTKATKLELDNLFT